MDNRSKRRSALTLASLFLFAGTATAQFGTDPSELTLIEVREDIYVINNPGVPGNVTVLVTDEGALLVDNKFPIDFENIMEMVESVTDQPVVYAINTHYHGDHSGNNAALQERGAKVVAAEAARVKMIDTGQPGLPDLTLNEQMRLHLGGVPVDIYHFGRGHTDGDVVVHFPEQRVLAAGDLYTVGQGLAQLVDYAGGGSARAWTGTLNKALMLDFETAIPGHGRVSSYAEFMAFRDDSQRLQDTVREMNRAGKSRAEIEMVLRSEFGFEDFHLNLSLDGLLVELQ